MTDVTDTEADNRAKDLLESLLDGADFSVENVDLASSEFEIPSVTGNAEYEEIEKLEEADITTRQVGGPGLFDGLMESMGAHLEKEYDAGRITGNDYTQAYIAMVTAALGNASQYLLQKDTVYWQNRLVQKQAQAAEATVVQSRMQVEIARAQISAARMEANSAATTFAQKKMQLALADLDYQIQEAELTKANYMNTDMLPAQLSQLQNETTRITAAKEQTLYQTASILPAQKSGIDLDNSIKTYQHDNLLPEQEIGLQKDNTTKQFALDYTLPAQLTNLSEQMEAHRAKTLDTRSNGSPVSGAIGKQKALHAQQITAYELDGKTKFVKVLTDSWAVDKSIDEGVTVPSSMNNSAINSAISALKTDIGL